MKKLVVFSVLSVALVAGLFQLVQVKAVVGNTPAPISAAAQKAVPTTSPTIQGGGCTMNQGMCEGMTACDMTQCNMKFCDKQNGKCPPGQCKKCMK